MQAINAGANAFYNATVAFNEGVIVVRMTRDYIQQVRGLEIPENALLLVQNASDLINGTGRLVYRAHDLVDSALKTLMLYKEVGESVADFVLFVRPFVIACSLLIIFASFTCFIMLGVLCLRLPSRAPTLALNK